MVRVCTVLSRITHIVHLLVRPRVSNSPKVSDAPQLWPGVSQTPLPPPILPGSGGWCSQELVPLWAPKGTQILSSS